jgi:hypothetical protein
MFVRIESRAVPPADAVILRLSTRACFLLVREVLLRTGEPSLQRLVPIEKMISWLFYSDARAMTFSSERSEHQITEASQAA